MHRGGARWVWLLGSTVLMLACGGRAALDEPGASNASAGAASTTTSGGAAAPNGGSPAAAGAVGSAGEGGSLRGRIATFEVSTNEVAIYSPNPVAGSAALTHISGLFDHEDCPDLTFDARANLYLLCDEQNSTVDEPAHVDVFAPDATGEAKPMRWISGTDTTLRENNMVRLGVDGAGSIYVLQVNYAAYPAIGSLTVFAADAQGDAPPIRTLILPGDGLSAASAFALDQHGRVFVGYTYSGLVRVFTANVDGTPAAIRTFGTNGDDGSAGIVDLAVDDNGLAYVLTSLQLRVYGPDAANDDPPLRIVTLDTNAQNAGLAVAVDGRVFLANDYGIAVLAANASGAATPLFTFGTAARNSVAIAP